MSGRILRGSSRAKGIPTFACRATVGRQGIQLVPPKLRLVPRSSKSEVGRREEGRNQRFDSAQHGRIQRTFFLGIFGFFGFFGFPSLSMAAAPPLPSPPGWWALEGNSSSLYRKLYHSTERIPTLEQFLVEKVDEVLPLDRLPVGGDGVISLEEEFDEQSGHWISDSIVTAVAADLVAQFYMKGTDPLYASGSDLIVRRDIDLIPIKPEELHALNQGFEVDGTKFDFREVKRFVRDAVLFPDQRIACGNAVWWPLWWWKYNRSPPERGKFDLRRPEMSLYMDECIDLVNKVKKAVQHERDLLNFRWELGIIAGAAEAIWDGQLTVTGSRLRYDLLADYETSGEWKGPLTATGGDLRTYDLLLDIAAVGNVLGSAPFQILFAEGNQGEQCDDPQRCPSCVLPAASLCGDSGVQGGEQCDDGNRLPGDGCDEFCQVEGEYCGNGKYGVSTRESWEMCDEGKECPDGTPCSTYKDCYVSGTQCGDADIADCKDDWERVCRFSGIPCTSDSQCPCPPSITNPSECARWKRNSCRYVFDGVCKIGGILEGTRCRAHQGCASTATCNAEGFCTNPGLPYLYLRCSRKEDCYSCSEEEVWGTCYEGGKCNGDEDCPKSGYCMLDVAAVCRPRTSGGSGSERSSCDAFCEGAPYCGDRVVYLDGSGFIEECDDGMQCADRTECAKGQRCADGSECVQRSAREAAVPGNTSCDENCKIQVCGDTRLNPPEECDAGARCIDGTSCVLTNPTACNGKGTCEYYLPNGDPDYCGPSDPCPPPPPSPPTAPPPPPNICRLDESCLPRSDDGELCDRNCEVEFCGDGIIQKNAPSPSGGEECDNGGLCQNGSSCTDSDDCQTAFQYCNGNPEIPCLSYMDCPRGKACLPPNATDACTPQSNDGCSASCRLECGDGTCGTSENCITCPGDCGTCPPPPPPPPFSGCGDGTLDSDGPDDIPGNVDDEQCEPNVLVRKCVAGPDDGSTCTSAADCDFPGTCRECPTNNCSNNCKNPVPGNCKVECGEQCDDGPVGGAMDNCSDAGILEYCGDGSVNVCGEVCDPPADLQSITPVCCGSSGSCCSHNDIIAGTCTPSCGSGAFCVFPSGTCEGCLVISIGCSIFSPSTCPSASPSCGDGCVDLPSEECDGGSKCTSSCVLKRCGDGTTDAVLCEECDPPNGTTCNASCQEIHCGDCSIDAPKEQCDTGGPPVSNDGDACDDSCKKEYCGDGTPQSSLGEICDDGGVCFNGTSCKTGDNPSTCPPVSTVCSPGGGACVSDADCGSGGTCPQVRATCVSEPCDSCRNDCKPNVCGNGIKECSEECDDGNTATHDGCDAGCKLEFCGDGVPDSDGADNKPGRANVDDDGINGKDDLGEKFFPGTDDEECDDGWFNNDTQQGTCRTNCTVAKCGDGVVDTALLEQCDQPTCPDGRPCTSNAECGAFWCRSRSDQGCSGSCLFEGCGDGPPPQAAYGEECDDGGRCMGGSSAGNACEIDDPSACPGGKCLPLSGDGCDSSCQSETSLCGDGVLDPDGVDGAPGKIGADDDRDALTDNSSELGMGDDEQCEPSDLTNGICPGGGSCTCPGGGSGCTPERALCDLGTCDPATRTCSSGNQTCTSDIDCQKPCINTCTSSCKAAARSCGDGYRDPGEQCDDGNTEGGDGCSFYCEIERLDLCGNGVVDTAYGEECDQGHPYATLECTPYCRLPHSAPMCGDRRKDPSGPKRGDLLTPLLTQSEGYRLDWRVPAGEQIRTTEWGRSPGTPGAFAPRDAEQASLAKSQGGWYVTPRLVVKRPTLETPFQTMYNRTAGTDPLDQRECSVCGDGALQKGEQCDSGRLSGGSYPNTRANMREWRRHVWGASFVRYAMPYYWQWYGRVFPFSFPTYQGITSFWYLSQWNQSSQSSYINELKKLYGGWYWHYANAAWDTMKAVEEKVFRQELCDAACTLQLCGNDRIEDGETCEDDNRFVYGRTVNGDGCSKECFKESGFNFAAARCGDDVIEAGEECDDGGRCVTVSKVLRGYCRFDNVDPTRIFCDADGLDNTPGTIDDETCGGPVSGDGCSKICKLEPLNDCGNEQLEPYEECDNGGECDDSNPTTEDAHCSSDSNCSGGIACVPKGGDGCDTQCKFEPPSCGNGITEPWNPSVVEECDEGSAVPTHCTPGPSGCKQAGTTCGDGKVEGAEQCDDGSSGNSNTDHNACRAGGTVTIGGVTIAIPKCVRPYCGDGTLDRGEECDDGTPFPPPIGTWDNCIHCLVPFCGNNLPDAGETCDDGNRTNGDGCSEWCLLENVCGNAEREGSEQCDDGNDWSGDGCSGVGVLNTAGSPVIPCQFEYCGDGVVQPGMGEQCDRGSTNANAPDACRLTCKTPVCGDAIKDTFEACDPGKHCKHDPSLSCIDDQECPVGPCDLTTQECMGDRSRRCTSDRACLLGECRVLDTPTCAANCTMKPKCGDRKVHSEEECDDGNTLLGDGCDSSCRLENPARCGNGRIEAGEECDDGNRADRDGCLSTCQLEDDDDRMLCGGPLCTGCTDCSKRGERYICPDGKKCLPEALPGTPNACKIGPCILRSECSTQCVFGLCGNTKIDAGEQCDDGRHCAHNPSQSCATGSDCNAGSCNGANIALGIPGRCSSDDLRACMEDADCRSLCLPLSGDGCSGACLTEVPIVKSGTGLILCQEEIGGLSGQSGQFGLRIGTGQVVTWQKTLLEPGRNPFLGPSVFQVRHLGSRGGAWWAHAWRWWDSDTLRAFAHSAWPWYWGGGGWSSVWLEGWLGFYRGWNGYWGTFYAECPPLMLFPNSAGHHLQAIAGCLGSLSRLKTTPDRAVLMPFEPVGITSYEACQEPKAQLVSAVEIPSLPPIFIPAYDPSELVADLEGFLCSETSSPRRAFTFLCTPTTPSLPKAHVSILNILESQVDAGKIWRELILAHTLDVGYRSGESTLSQYLQEAFTALASSLDTAVRLFADLQRIKFPDKICPLGSTPLCPP